MRVDVRPTAEDQPSATKLHTELYFPMWNYNRACARRISSTRLSAELTKWKDIDSVKVILY